MRSKTDKLFDLWDDLGLWNQYGIVVVGAVVILNGLMHLPQII